MSSWPWFPFYVNDFLASAKVRKMNAAQVGTYLLLMLEQWQEGHVKRRDLGELAEDTKSTPEDVQKVLTACFEKRRHGWVNRRLEELRDGQDAKSTKAKASANARWKATSDANALRPQSERNASQNQSHSQNQNHTPPTVESASEKGGTKKPKRAKPTPTECPADWKPTEGHRERAKRDGLDIDYEAEEFKHHHEAKGSLWASWDAAFWKWLGNAKKFADRDRQRGRGAIEFRPPPDALDEAQRESLFARELAKRLDFPPPAKESPGPLAGSVARILEFAAPPTEKAG